MKKTVLALFFMAVTINAFPQNSNSGVIKELSGTVELKAAGTANFVPAEIGAALRQDTIISTGFKSMALIEVGSTNLTVRPLTRLTLTEIYSGQEEEALNVNLQTGRVRVNVNPPAGTKASMSVTTPVATASVRGTEFDITTEYINVHEGKVNYQGKKGHSVTVGTSYASEVGSYNVINTPKNSNAGFTPRKPAGVDSSSPGKTGGGGKTRSSGDPGSPGEPSSPGDGGNGGGSSGGGGGGTYGPSGGGPSGPSGPQNPGSDDNEIGIEVEFK